VIPRKRCDGLFVQSCSDEVLIYDSDRQKAHWLTTPFAKVWENCDGVSSASQIAARLQQEGVSVDEELVWLIIRRLNKMNLLTQTVNIPSGAVRSSRRELARKVACLGGISLFMAKTVIVPTPAHAASFTPCW